MLFSRDSAGQAGPQGKVLWFQDTRVFGNSEHFISWAALQKLNLMLPWGSHCNFNALPEEMVLFCNFGCSYRHILQERLRVLFRYFVADPWRFQVETRDPDESTRTWDLQKQRTLPRASSSCGLTERLWGHLPTSHNQAGKVQVWDLSHLLACMSNYLPIYCMALLGHPGKPARHLLLHGCSGWRLTQSGIV